MRYLLLALIFIATIRTVSGEEAHPAPSQSTNGEIGLALISDFKTGSILVEGKLEGHPAVMVLDTGAAQTMFDAKEFGLSPVDLEAARLNQRGVGLDANVVWRRVNFSIGDASWTQKEVAIANLEDLSKIYARKVDGIVGEDVLREFRSVTINYKWHCVMLTR
ncbi:hypothetical protein GCM10011507_06410 [Edaphobacter acidisoli]|uniref:Aspartyl protease n=1 Tax=Edaphobacter acidisoli TaxID=2040573 RepID=A0A916RII1_9BACT|nr:retropepsin-like aspartic protease [Edaphobacter acidisoli]GGA57777.1 hypothetical protein GCM10011507_06410 [Edaphobacter acidisoli]